MTYFLGIDLMQEVYGAVQNWKHVAWIKQDELAAGIKKRSNQPDKPFQVLVVSYDHNLLDKPCNREEKLEKGFKTFQEALLYMDGLKAGKKGPVVEAI